MMDWLDAKTTLMPQPMLSRLVSESKPGRIHPHLRERDQVLHADDFEIEEAPSVIEPVPVIGRARAERFAVIALAASFALFIAAMLGFPF